MELMASFVIMVISTAIIAHHATLDGLVPLFKFALVHHFAIVSLPIIIVEAGKLLHSQVRGKFPEATVG